MFRKTTAALLLGLAIAFMASCGSEQKTTASRTPEERLKSLGIQLPPAPKPVASYVPAVRAGNLVFLAGQGPLVDGKPTVTGKIGAELSEKQGYEAARAAVLVWLAALRGEL